MTGEKLKKRKQCGLNKFLQNKNDSRFSGWAPHSFSRLKIWKLKKYVLCAFQINSTCVSVFLNHPQPGSYSQLIFYPQINTSLSLSLSFSLPPFPLVHFIIFSLSLSPLRLRISLPGCFICRPYSYTICILSPAKHKRKWSYINSINSHRSMFGLTFILQLSYIHHSFDLSDLTVCIDLRYWPPKANQSHGGNQCSGSCRHNWTGSQAQIRLIDVLISGKYISSPPYW